MTIEAWYRLHKDSSRSRYENPPVKGFPHGVIPDGTTLREGDGHTRLAEFVRYGEKPQVRLILPNQLTIGRHREIRDVVLAEGGSVFAVPMNVLHIAEIVDGTIEVVHTKPSKHAFRADEQVLKAMVNYPVFYRDSWGFRSVSQYKTREAYFLSGYDRNEKGLSYFFCEMPVNGKPQTVKEAYEMLKPESVKQAEKAGVKVKRQGDMFFIRMKGWQPDEVDEVRAHNQYLHDSNHLAEEVVWKGKHGSRLTYVRGVIAHRPSGRRPDHANLNLGRTHWWLCVRNTVPVGQGNY
jgi:hypothetical protein